MFEAIKGSLVMSALPALFVGKFGKTHKSIPRAATGIFSAWNRVLNPIVPVGARTGWASQITDMLFQMSVLRLETRLTGGTARCACH